MSFVLLVVLVLLSIVFWETFKVKTRTIVDLDEQNQLLEQERELVIRFMHNMVEALGGGADRSALWEQIVHASIQATGALSAAVFELQNGSQLKGVAVEGLFPPHRHLPESSRMKLTTRAKYIEQILKSETFVVGEGIVGSVAKTKKGELVPDATEDTRINQHDDPALLVRSIIVCPILFQNQLLGVLAVVNPADGLEFNKTDFSLVENLAEQAGLAIHNADIMHIQMEKNRLDMELELASNIQGLLLPKAFPKTDELDVHATYIPAQKVGGDLYDIFVLDAHRVGIAIADVSGKGVPGSLLMAICQTNLRHFARRHDSPARVLSAINGEMMNAGMRKDKFVTMVYGIIDTRKNEIVLARGGHEPPLYLQRVGPHRRSEVISVQSEGMALGMVPSDIFDEIVEDKVIPFHPGEVFVLYTDGVTEAVNEEGTEFAFSRLADRVSLLTDQPSRVVNNGIMDAVVEFSARDSYEDDLTLVTVVRTGSSEESG